ncbi:glycoside hydrolase family 3 protein [Pseudomonas petrae]|uniref:Glycoside hydrolase family 3 C-terminal domain-containing protein n=1 Tax=Pseudomonas petrae TaxID=2912190 RepID=A0ABS9I6Q7_9PSED|nr:glycoside hydrolase family 3 C-terminal domain-containing protein [Pseudomonas petrae]MCF7535901.1 glycoside hydrolase family 3 C-terminal domain-containing protein [Pseudomonas petrae]MCF7542763.1 glycoside hydrolase family 3 C-terminal domain-containing protein [Pseudomonas petrae]MCF7554965.1 glycoside hydrolase family 3 C-terminal domain-containing protein [Pseudomonas petrae]
MSAFKHTLALSLLSLGVLQANLALAAVTPATGDAVEARVSSILDNMNQSEKINFTRVDDGHMIPSLLKWGIKGTVAYDSSMGVHVNNATFGAQYPSQSALAATWSINRAKEFGLAIAYETRISGGQQMLSPGVNLYRTPYNGRSAEYASGEDPFIGAVLAPAVVNGIQAQGIQASGKHYLANEQEANRQGLNVVVDERTLRELYLPGFESMVKNANVASIMCGFNKINGDYACENHHLITEVLKGEWGYQGTVISDFNAIHDAFKGAWAGTDIDMPSGLQFTEANLMPHVWSGQLSQNVIDDKVKRNLRAIVSYDFQEHLNTANTLDHPEYGQRASLNTARESIVLLRNEKTSAGKPLLPLARDAKIAVIGDWAYQAPASPFGTANSPPSSYVTELSGLQQLASSSTNVTYLPELSLNPTASAWYQPAVGSNNVNNAGVKAEYFSNTSFSGSPVVTRVEPGVNLNWTTGTNETNAGTTAVSGFSPTPGAFSARYTATIKPTVSGAQVFKVRADGPYKLWVNDELVLQSDGKPYAADVVNALTTSGKTAALVAGKSYTVKLEYQRVQANFIPALGGVTGVQMSWAALRPPKDLSKYDAVVIATGSNYEHEGEGADHGFELPDQQAELISFVTKANPNTIVVMHGGGVADMQPWANKVGASLQAWFPGQQGGQALAEILFGNVNPSGKLPITIDKKIEDNPSYASYPDPAAYRGDNALTEMTYSEGLYMGYRGYDKKHAKPLYPFGYGLSYTTFDYSDLKLSTNVMAPGSTVDVTFKVTNTGDKAGFEVAQLYVHPNNPAVDRPEKELKGFTKVYLQPGESKTVSIPIDSRSLAYYVEKTDSWDVDAGKFKILVGPDSEDLPLDRTLITLFPEHLTTRDSNPLPLPLRKAVQVSALQTY